MVNVYFMVMDTSRDREDPNQMWFAHCSYNNDLSGQVRAMARRNNSDVSDIRLFVYPTKKEWQALKNAFVKRADWTR